LKEVKDWGKEEERKEGEGERMVKPPSKNSAYGRELR